MPPLPSQIGRFRILELLGEGAMGRVYLGEDSDLERRVAIKVISSSADQEARDRFRHEARSIGQLAHPNIVLIHEFGFEGDSPYLVMECLEGMSLEQWLSEPRPLINRLAVLRDLCRAVSHAHQRGVLHRDIKPSNVQVLPDGSAKLVDFGIARSGSTQLTATGVVLGTPEYLAPEILSDVRYSQQSDLYAVSLVAFRTLAGHNPYRAKNLEACLTRILTMAAPPLAEFCPTLPHELCAVIDRSLAKEPELRPADLESLESALNRTLAALTGGHLEGSVAGLVVKAPTATGRATDEVTSSLSPTIPLATGVRPWAEGADGEAGASSETGKTTILPRPSSPASSAPPAMAHRPPRANRKAGFVAALALFFAVVGLGWWWRTADHSADRPSDPEPAHLSASGEVPPELQQTSPPSGDTSPASPPPSNEEPTVPTAGQADDRPTASPTVSSGAGSVTGQTKAEQTKAEPPEVKQPAITTNRPPAGTAPPPPRPAASEVTPPAHGSNTGSPGTNSGSTNSGTPAESSSAAPSPVDLPAALDGQPSAGPKITEPPGAVPQTVPPTSPDGSNGGPSPSETDTATRIVIEAISPTFVRRGSTATLVVQGTGFTADSHAVFKRAGQPVEALRVQRLTVDRKGRLRIVVAVAHTVPLGTHTLYITSADGVASAPVQLEVGL